MTKYNLMEFSNTYEANEYINNYLEQRTIKNIIPSKDGFIILFEYENRDKKLKDNLKTNSNVIVVDDLHERKLKMLTTDTTTISINDNIIEIEDKRKNIYAVYLLSCFLGFEYSVNMDYNEKHYIFLYGLLKYNSNEYDSNKILLGKFKLSPENKNKSKDFIVKLTEKLLTKKGK